MTDMETLRTSEAALPRKRRYWIKTFGCQMNVHDSEIYAGLLGGMGYEAAEHASDADLVLVNTCSVRERAEDKLFSQLGRLRQIKDALSREGGRDGEPRELLVGVTGCIAQQRGEEIIDRQPTVDFVIGTRAIHGLESVVDRVRGGLGPQVNTEDEVQFEIPGAHRVDRVRAFVTIMEGCNNYCSFCIVPSTRGLEVYRSAHAIVDEIRGLGLRGYREVTLLGQNVNSWVDPDTGMDFPGLLAAIDDMLRSTPTAEPRVDRVRFLTSHPKDFSPRLIEAMAECQTVANHIHLPVQSGSDRILHQMNRHYTVDTYRDQVRELRGRIPEVGLSTDIIVGFPGETAADFEATLRLVRDVEYDSFYSFEYSQRPETAALNYEDDVPAQVKRDRLLELQDVGREIQEQHNASWLGRRAEVLVDSLSKRTDEDVSGRTSSNHIVNMPGAQALIGTLVDVEVTSYAAHSLYGRVIGDGRAVGDRP
jgi:tRNA-2-methylthio-N6-dimethylallyladenosine synthase